MHIEEIQDVERLGTLAAEWSELSDRCPWTSPFQRPEWLLPWCRHFAPDELWVLAAREQRRLVGLLPFFIFTSPRATGSADDFVEERVVAILGTGNSDYLDLIAEPGLAADSAAAFFACLAARPERWDVCNFEELRPASPLLAAPLPEGWQERRVAQEACPALLLTAGARLRDLVPRRRVRNLDLLERRAALHGGAEVIVAGAENWDQILAALFRLHGARWHERGQPGVLASEELQAFHREVAAGFVARDALALHALVLADEIVAVNYGFYERCDALSYLSGFDPGWADCKPGVLLKGAVIEAALRRGCTRFDFLRGQEPHKYFWGAEDRWNSLRRLRRAQPVS